MSCSQVATGVVVSAAYSLDHFYTEWKALSNKVSNLVTKLSAETASGRRMFEGELDNLNFDQMNLVSRVSSLSATERAGAKARMEETEQALETADRLMYPAETPTLNSVSKSDIFIAGIKAGLVSGVISSVVHHFSTPTPEGTTVSDDLTEEQANAFLTAHNDRVLNQYGAGYSTLSAHAPPETFIHDADYIAPSFGSDNTQYPQPAPEPPSSESQDIIDNLQERIYDSLGNE